MGRCLNCLVISLGILSFLSVALFFYFNTLVETAVRGQLVLAEGNELYEKWIKVPVGFAAYKYVFFEILNPDEALKGAKVSVRERGPYCFKHMRYKRILGWGPNNSTIRYMEYKVFYFDYGCSGDNSLDDTFYLINPLFAALGQTLSDMIEDQLPMAPLTAPVAYTMVNTIMDAHGQTLFFKKSVREILFGFKINLLDTMDNFVKPLKRLGITFAALPPNPPDNMFGLMYARNDTPEGEHEIYTGQAGTSHIFGYFASHKGKKTLNFWKGDKCNEIRGSDGTLFPPFINSETVLSAFAMDLCRSFDFKATGWGEYKGIKGLLYGFPETAFATPENYPDNECFCMFTGKRRQRRCTIDGTFDLGGCQGGAPIIVTNPHFLKTNPDLGRSVEGLAPDPVKHATYLIVQPTLGAPIFGSKKLQFGIRIERVPYLRNLQGVRSAVIPFLWAEEFGGLNDEMADQIKNMMINPLSYAETGIAGTALVSTLSFLALLFMKLSGGKKPKKNSVASSDSTQVLVKQSQNGSIPPPPPPPPPPPVQTVSVQTSFDTNRQTDLYANGYSNGYGNGYPNEHPNGNINGSSNGSIIQGNIRNGYDNGNLSNGNPRWQPVQQQMTPGVWTTGTGQFVNSNYNNNVRGGHGKRKSNGNNNLSETLTTSDNDVERGVTHDTLFQEMFRNRSFRQQRQQSESEGSLGSRSSQGSVKTVTISKKNRVKTPPKPNVVISEEVDMSDRQKLESMFDEGTEVTLGRNDDGYESYARNLANPYPDYLTGLENDSRRKSMPTPVPPKN